MILRHVDTSAVGRLRQERVARKLAAIGGEGVVARCVLVDLELLRFAPGKLAPQVRLEMDVLERAPVTQADLARALEVQAEMTFRGQHHGVPAVDLVIAAVAERAGATLIHYDADFERIAEITDQPVEWVVPRGEAD